MNKVVGLLSLCVVCAILKAVLIALVVALLLGLVYAFVTRPRETLLFVGVVTISGLATARPTETIVVLGVIGVAVVLARGRRPARGSRHQADPRRLSRGPD